MNDSIERNKRFMRDLCGNGTFRGHGYRVDAPTPRAGRYPMGSVEERVTLAGQVFEADLRQWELIGDDRVPWLHVWSGTEVFAAAFGSRVHYVGEAMPFALPAVHTAAEADRLQEPDIFSGPLGEMFAIGDRLVARYGEDYPLQICDIQSPLDIAALIWEKAAFYAALVEEPKAVHRLVGKVCNTLEQFVDEWKRRYRNACLVHFPDYWMPPEYGICLSEDEIGSISGAMFDEFSLPYLARLSARYGGISIHCCANSEHQWGNLLKIPGLRTLNLNRDLPAQIRSLAFFAGRLVLIPQGFTGKDPLGAIGELLRHAPPEVRFFFPLAASSLDEARRLSDGLRPLLGRS
jgi:uroporphyrinogen-III decarboxylase